MSNAADAQRAKPTGGPVLREIRRIKQELSASYGHDVDRLFAESRQRQERSGRPVVNLQTKRGKP